jgi:hypothetical protein
LDLARVSLEDKYTLPSDRIYLSGIQALARQSMMQRQRAEQQRSMTCELLIALPRLLTAASGTSHHFTAARRLPLRQGPSCLGVGRAN